jgi:hypothetical protein
VGVLHTAGMTDETSLEIQLKSLIAEKCRLDLSDCYVFISQLQWTVRVRINHGKVVAYYENYPITTLIEGGPEKLSDMVHLDYVFRVGE